MNEQNDSNTVADRSDWLGVFTVFLKLGLTSFGGPVAHIGYFRREFVEERRWLSDSQFAQLLAICQFLPGPASSQLGFCIGLLRSGWCGALAAFVAFTAPSVLLLVIFAQCYSYFSSDVAAAVIHGLKIVAFAVVAQGVLGMLRQLCPDTQRIVIAVLSASVALLAGSASVQLAIVVAAAIGGVLVCHSVKPLDFAVVRLRYSARSGTVLLTIFMLLLVGLPWLGAEFPGLWSVAGAFYRAGALVFGGGHVVLPLLEEAVVGSGWMQQSQFLAGYGAAQAVPGPMFSLAAYLGFGLPDPTGGIAGAGLALLSIFLPGFLLVAGLLPLWQKVTGSGLAASAIAGINAAVVGILGATLYDPVFIAAIDRPEDMATAAVAFTLLVAFRLSALYVVLWCVLASMAAVFIR